MVSPSTVKGLTGEARRPPSSGAAERERASLRVIDALKANPSYLLVFGLALIGMGGAGAVGVGGLIQNNTPSAGWGFATLCVMMASAVAVVFISSKHQLAGPVESPGPNVGNSDFQTETDEIFKNLRTALLRAHPVFLGYMREQCQLFRFQTDNWANGQLQAQDRMYSQLMIETYAAATEKIFATSTLDYLPIWEDTLGKQILKSSTERVIPTTRVFIFEHKAEITDRVIAILRRHAESATIAVMISVEDDWPGRPFPDDVSRNFVFIDEGDIICSTERVADGRRRLAGTWHIKEPNVIPTYRSIMGRLLRDNLSVKLDDFLLNGSSAQPTTVVPPHSNLQAPSGPKARSNLEKAGPPPLPNPGAAKP